MKKRILSACVLSALGFLSVSMAFAEQGVFTGRAAVELAKALNRRTLYCFPTYSEERSEEEAGFFPLNLSALDDGRGNVTVRIGTGDPKLRFGYGGSEMTDLEVTRRWFILSVGDDGRRHLFLEHFTDADTKAGKDGYQCYRDEKTGGFEEYGNISGVVSEIWDAGTIHSMGVTCCIDYE